MKSSHLSTAVKMADFGRALAPTVRHGNKDSAKRRPRTARAERNGK